MLLNRHQLFMLAGVALVGLLSARSGVGSLAQNFPTSTPIQIDLGQAAPDALQQSSVTSTPTRTPTPLGPVQIEANGVGNVRALPDPGAELLGQIRPGEFYNAIRRYYRWIEFQYDASPNKRGWVFDELVTIHGDESALPSVTSLEESSADIADIDATVTGEAITMTPGALLTATAIARTNPAPIVQSDGGAPQSVQVDGLGVNATVEPATRVALPTYTYPPGIAAFQPTTAPTVDAEVTEAPVSTAERVGLLTDNFPPIVPIIVLAALGLLGLAVSGLRR